MTLDGVKKSQVNISQIKTGMERTQIEGDEKLESIFDTLDTNNNGILEENEIKHLDQNKDSTVTKKEAKNFIKQNNLKNADIKKQDIINFLKQYGQWTPNITNAVVNEQDGSITITYKDNSVKTINPNNTSEIATKGENGETIVKKFSNDKKLTSTEITNNDGSKETTKYDENGIPIETVIEKKDGSKTTRTYNSNGEPLQEVTIENGGNPIKTVTFNGGLFPSALTIKNGITVEEYIYDKDGKPVLTTKKENEGIPTKERITTYTQNEDGTITATIKEYGKETTQTIKDNKVLSETITENGNTNEITFNNENKRLNQIKTLTNGETYEISYDGKGNTIGIIVQNNESIESLANKFHCTPQEIIDANKDAVKGSGNKKYFLVGTEIKIPKELEADDTALQGRKSASETIADYAQEAEIRRQKAEAAKQQKAAEAEARAAEDAKLKALGMTERANGEVKAHFAKTPNKIITLKKVANAINGRSICVDKNGNYVVVAKDGIILKMDYVQNSEKYEQARKYNANVKIRKNAENLAQQFYQIADDNSGLNSMKKMQELLDTKINSKNIVAFLDAYDREKTKQGDSSIIDTVTSEIGAGGSKQQRQVLMTIMDKLCAAAKEQGVSNGDIQRARHDFEASLNKEFNAVLRRTNPKDMEKAIDFLRGAIASKANGGGQISEKEAIEQFNSTFEAENATAQKDYREARENEGWTAKVGDTVCGWFGCNTIADMDKKLGANAASVKKLANSKTEAEFKKNYKEVFGIEFDKNKISARQTAIEKYNLAQNCNSTIKLTNQILKSSGSYSDLKTALKKNFQYDNNTINQIIDSYAAQAGKNNPSDEEKRELLVKFLQDTKSNASQNLRTVSNGKTLEQMGKDVDLITRSAFGTNDIVKDVIQFNENQQTTEMVTEAAFEIAGTVALQFVPGLGQMAAARLAVSAARWGTKAVKVANYATKAEKAFATVNKFQKGETIANAATRTTKAVNKGVQIGTQMMNAGIATGGVDLSNGKSVKEATQKALMNMSFAGVGASSSILAPKLMSAFGIADKALATEIAEEIINAAGSYGITKLEGGTYGSTDAFVDFASGLIMSRISHVKGTTKPQGTTDVPHADVEVKEQAKDVYGDVARGADAKHLNANERKILDDALDGTPTREDQARYDKEIAYQAPTDEQRLSIDKNNAEVQAAHSEAHQIQNVVDNKSATALQQAKDNLSGPYSQVSGIFRDDSGVEFTYKKGKLVEIKAPDGRKITKELNIAKYEHKHNINPENLIPVSITPEIEIVNPRESINPEPVTDMNSKTSSAQGGFKPVKSRAEAEKLYDKLIAKQFIGKGKAEAGKPIFWNRGGEPWMYTLYQNIKQQGTPWKMHLYANSPEEWANVAKLAMPYLTKNEIEFKTMLNLSDEEFDAIRNTLNSEGQASQTGKAFTIYFESEEQFVKTAKALEEIFEKSGLKSSGKTMNEAQIGESGFLSYRHEGAERGVQYKPDNIEDPYLNSMKSQTEGTNAAKSTTDDKITEEINSQEIIYQPTVETPLNGKITIEDNIDMNSQVKKVLDETGILSKNPEELLAMLNDDFCTSSKRLDKGHITFEKDNIDYTLVYDSNNKLVALNVNLNDTPLPKVYKINNNKISEIDLFEYHQINRSVLEKFEEPKKLNINSKLEERPNIADIIEEFNKNDITHNMRIKHGKINYEAGEIYYEVIFDKSGQVLGYSKHNGLTDVNGEHYLYNKKGKPEKVEKQAYNDKYYQNDGKEIVDELFGLNSTQIDIETFLKHSGTTDTPRFNNFTVNELNSLVKNSDDSRILNALLTDKKFQMPIDSQLNSTSIRAYTYNCDDIINVLKSDKAKTFILDKLNSGNSFSKADLKKLDKDLFFEPSSYKLDSTRDLSHKIEDLPVTNADGTPVDDKFLNYVFEHSSEFRQKIPSGEVANINGHMYVNDDGHLTKLGLSKEKFEELFPIEKRHQIKQGGIGDCWLVTSMGALMDSPKGRAGIYKMFSQDGDDILVKFPDADEAIRFSNGELNKLAPVSVWLDGYKPQIGFGDAHVKGSKGIRMLEQAYSIHRNDGYGKANIKDKYIQDIFFMNKQMTEQLTGGFQNEAISNIMGIDNVVTKISFDRKEFIKLIDEAIDDPNKIVTFSTSSVDGTNTKYDLVSGHAYHIVAFDREKGILSISNPWHNNEIKQVPVNDWLNYIIDVGVMKLI